ncbi:MAG: CBS domain-containing protein [Alphaproteobacteria bacterium]
MLVASILQNKGNDVQTIKPDATIGNAVSMLKKYGIGSLVVSSTGRDVAGILSERDIVAALDDEGAALLDQSVSSQMSREVTTCGLGDTSRGVLEVMTERRIRHVPVVENGELCGMVSIGDAVKARLDEVTHEADALREYIAHT